MTARLSDEERRARATARRRELRARMSPEQRAEKRREADARYRETHREQRRLADLAYHRRRPLRP